MRCLKPYLSGKAAYPCGQCRPCRVVKGSTWLHRILLESFAHARNSFVTLTLDDEFVAERRGSVRVSDVQGWLKRLRKNYDSGSIRFFAVGEYGGRTGRPHYHAALFGIGCDAGPFELEKGRMICKCQTCSNVNRTWGYGHTLVGELTPRSAAYISRYLIKKWTRDCPELMGRSPEFSRMSLRPGVGASAVGRVVSAMQIGLRSQVPQVLVHGQKRLPLGRYLRRRIKDYFFEELGEVVSVTSDEPDAELQLLREAAFACSQSLREVIAEYNAPYDARIRAREMIRHETF